MAAGQAAVMRALGFARFAVVRHDRGGRVAHRMARDHPVAVERITVFDMALPATLFGCRDHEPD
jgi:haloacetate dehalogenase